MSQWRPVEVQPGPSGAWQCLRFRFSRNYSLFFILVFRAHGLQNILCSAKCSESLCQSMCARTQMQREVGEELSHLCPHNLLLDAEQSKNTAGARRAQIFWSAHNQTLSVFRKACHWVCSLVSFITRNLVECDRPTFVQKHMKAKSCAIQTGRSARPSCTVCSRTTADNT